jgi:hypothetical protein
MSDRPPSRDPGPYGRGTSFGLPTSGFKGWMPVQFSRGKHLPPQEGFKNVVDNREFIPKEGWNGEPPEPTGELTSVRHAGDAYRMGWERIWGSGSASQPSEN